MTRRIATALAALSIATGALALEPRARQEIEFLLTTLAQSNCQFYRNGSWHEAAPARTHLEKKYTYLLDKGLIKSAEDFIERAASTSSISGEAYQVRCGATAAQPSASWLREQLTRYRAR